MLNRRIFRIKAMQALYSFYTAQKSLVFVVRHELERVFTPTADTHDLSDTEEIDAHRKQALALYDQNLPLKEVKMTESIPKKVFEEVTKAISSFYSQVEAEGSQVKRQMLDSIHDLQNVYYKFLLLPGEFQRIESLTKQKEETSKIARNESWTHQLTANPIIDALDSFQPLQEKLSEKKLSWQQEFNLLKSWYKDILKADGAMPPHQQKKAPTLQDHKDSLIHFYKKVIFKNKLMTEYWEKRDVCWSENGSIIKSMLTKTIQEYEPESDEPIKLKLISVNEEEDFKFFETIYSSTIKGDEYLEGLISQRAKNWDISRLAMTDQIILKMALTEMIHCQSIPIKVTINEYIEVCKHYSTPKSKQFVNGMLDVLANQLALGGVVKKTGRGLIDNK